MDELTVRRKPVAPLMPAEAAIYWWLMANVSSPPDFVYSQIFMSGGRPEFDDAVHALRRKLVLF